MQPLLHIKSDEKVQHHSTSCEKYCTQMKKHLQNIYVPNQKTKTLQKLTKGLNRKKRKGAN